MDIGIDQNDALEGGEDVAEFGGVGLQELPACRHVEEEVIDLEVTTHRTGGRLLSRHLRACYHQTRTYLILLTAREQLYLSHSSDRGQGLTTESHGAKGKEIVGLEDLGGGMALERETGIGLRHALTVVDDLDGGPASIDNQHMNRRGTCIDGILDQLLDYGSRALDHLTSSYLVGDTIGEKMNHIGHFLPRQLKISSRLSGRI